jgi:ATP-dependent Clp protease ATP-binding subunit ClpC
MQLANQEAQRFNHEYIGTEHILLGLVREGSGVAADVLMNLGIDLRMVRLEVEKLLSAGPTATTGRFERFPQTPRAKKVIEYSMEEARNLKHDYVGSEHLLLGLLSERKCVAEAVLTGLGVTVDQVRSETLKLLGSAIKGTYGACSVQPRVYRWTCSRQPRVPRWMALTVLACFLIALAGGATLFYVFHAS